MVSSVISITGALPIFMLAALVALVRPDLGLTEQQFGITVSVFFGTAAVASVSVGQLTERLGGATSLGVGALLSGMSMVGIATSNSWNTLTVWSFLAGLGHVASQLGANHRLSFAIPHRRQGIAFGIRQSGPPAASLIGGLSVPWIALSFGWRSAVFLAAALPIIVGSSQIRPAIAERRRARRESMRGFRLGGLRLPLIVLAFGAVFVTAPLTALASFIVDYMVLQGVAPGMAGTLLAIASIFAILVRICAGQLADSRTRDSLLLVPGMIAIGALAFFALGRNATALGLGIAGAIAYGFGWGWPGLFIHGIVRRNRAAPAAATGIPQMGMFGGGALGPALFGTIVVRYGYEFAWNLTALSMIVGASLLAIGIAMAPRPQ